MSDAQALALLLFLAGAFFLLLGVAPLVVFDRFGFWEQQARDFRKKNIAATLGRVVWGGFGLFLVFAAAFTLLRG